MFLAYLEVRRGDEMNVFGTRSKTQNQNPTDPKPKMPAHPRLTFSAMGSATDEAGGDPDFQVTAAAMATATAATSRQFCQSSKFPGP